MMIPSHVVHSNHFQRYHFEKGNPPDFPELLLTDAVIKEFDRNTYYGVSNHNVSGVDNNLKANGWDLHASTADPRFVRSAESVLHPWNRSCTDYTPAVGSPADTLGFRPIDAENIGLTPAGFKWDQAALNLKDMRGGRKLQAESYNRMRGLWRVGSSWIGGSGGAGKGAHYPFTRNAWARYDNVHSDCTGTCTLQVRYKSPAAPDPFSPPEGSGRMLRLSMHAPVGKTAVLLAATATPIKSADWAVLNLTVAEGGGSFAGETIFIAMDGEIFIDWIRIQ